MRQSWKLATVAGIDIKVHFSFVLVLALGAWQWAEFGLRGAVFGAVMMALLFACVALHELGHSLVAKAFGVPVKDITLLPIGGVAQLGKKPEKPLHELLIAVAGPLVNVVIAGVLFAVTYWQFGAQGITTAVEGFAKASPSALTLQMMLILSNVMLAVFNMLPAFPMDGGRVLRALLAMVLKEPLATLWAVRVGRVLAVGLFGVGLALGNFMLPFIAAFIYFAAGAELREAKLSAALKGVRVADAVNPYVPRFTPATTVGEAMQALVFTPHQAFAVEQFGKLVGVVTRAVVMQTAEAQGPHVYLAGLMERDVPTVSPHAALEDARKKMNEALVPYVAVADGERFLGLITELELAQQLLVVESIKRVAPRSDAGRTVER